MKFEVVEKRVVPVEILEDVRIPGTNIILERGDKIRVLKEEKEYSHSSLKLMNNSRFGINSLEIIGPSEEFVFQIDLYGKNDKSMGTITLTRDEANVLIRELSRKN